MSRPGAVSRSITKPLEDAIAAVVRGLRIALGRRRPRLVPIPVRIEPGRRR